MAVVISPWTYWPQFNLGKPLYNGNIYIGVADTDPEIPANQKDAILIQEGGAQIPAEQPIKIGNGGVATYSGSPVAIDVTGDYSLKVTDKNGVQVYYFANGGEVEDLLQTDLRSVMFDLGLVYSDIGVTLVTSTAGTSLDGAQYIVDVDTGAAWSLPEGIPSGSTVVSISGSTLTTNNGDFELTTAPNQQSNLDDMIDGTYRSPENRLKSLQQWNISDNDTDPLISSTPTDYAVGEFPAKNVEVTTASTQLKYVSGVVSSDDDVGVLTVTFANDNPDISSENQYVGVVLADGTQAEAGTVTGVTKSGAAGADITCSIDLSVFTDGFKWFFVMPERGNSYAATNEESINSSTADSLNNHKWVDVTSERAVGVPYINESPFAIFVSARIASTDTASKRFFLAVDGVFASTSQSEDRVTSVMIPPTKIPSGSEYIISIAGSGSFNLAEWSES